MTVSTDRGRPHWLIFFGLAAIVLVADQVAKAWLVGMLDPGEMLRVVGDLVRLVHSQNRGALFGLFQDSAVLFGIVSIGVIGLIVWYHGHSGPSTLMSVALGLLLGGALGNMIDRLRLGYVVDFVDLGIGDLRWYTFNVADSAISLAIVLLLASAFLPARRSAVSDPGEAADAPKGDAADAPKGEGADA